MGVQKETTVASSGLFRYKPIENANVLSTYGLISRQIASTNVKW